MNLIIKARGKGKTTELVKLSHDKNIPILCMDARHYQQVISKAKQLGFSTFPEPRMLNGDLLGYHGDVLIDELDAFLRRILGCNVHTATLNEHVVYTKSEIAKLIGKSEDDFEIV